MVNPDLPEVGEIPTVEELWRHAGCQGEPLVLQVHAHPDGAGRELGLGRRLQQVSGEVLPFLELARQSNLQIFIEMHQMTVILTR